MPLKNNNSMESTIDNKLKKSGLNQKSSNKLIAIRFDDNDKQKLSDHFKQMGIISLSEGIRRVIYDYMKTNNI